MCVLCSAISLLQECWLALMDCRLRQARKHKCTHTLCARAHALSSKQTPPRMQRVSHASPRRRRRGASPLGAYTNTRSRRRFTGASRHSRAISVSYKSMEELQAQQEEKEEQGRRALARVLLRDGPAALRALYDRSCVLWRHPPPLGRKHISPHSPPASRLPPRSLLPPPTAPLPRSSLPRPSSSPRKT